MKPRGDATSTLNAPSLPPEAAPQSAFSSTTVVADSWEEMADTCETKAPSGDRPLPQQVEALAVGGGGGGEKRGQALGSAKAPLKSASAPSLDEVATRKQPSPSLSDKPSRARSGGVDGTRSGQAPPPKAEDDKDNVNIVFIGHVGE